MNVQTQKEAKYQKFMPVPIEIDPDRMMFAPMPGNIVSLPIKEGDTVTAGQEMVVIEAMKMQNVFTARRMAL